LHRQHQPNGHQIPVVEKYCDLLSTLPSLVKNPRFQARGFFFVGGVTSALGNGSLFCHGVKLLTIALSPRRVFLRTLPHGAATR